jgi:hypothetical protein
MKLDLYKKHKTEYVAPKKPVVVDVKPARYLAIEGRGEPGGETFQAAIGALYNVAFTIKMARKFARKGDYTVCKLEGLWQDKTHWQLMISTPDFIDAKNLAEARKKLAEKGRGPLVDQVKLIGLDEGRCVQMLHMGPYDRVDDTVAIMEAKAGKTGRHHEIYLSDPRRVAPAKLRTIVRRPIA